jgi:hypothetical protein
MNAQGQRHVARVAFFETDALECAVEAEHAIAQIRIGARIEQRLAGDAARAPVFGDLIALREAEIREKLLRRQRPQLLLGQHGDLPPSGRVGHSLGIDALEPLLMERRAKRILDRSDLAFPLEGGDLGTRFRDWQRHRQDSLTRPSRSAFGGDADWSFRTPRR